MSAGAESDIDPDLTAMLDMVMQLLMFFIICAHVIKAEKNEDVKLPRSDEAHLIEGVDKESYFINLVPYHLEDMKRRINDPNKMKFITENLKFEENDPCILIPGEDYPMKPVELNPWLKSKAEFAQKLSPDGKVHKVIVMRADRNLEYALVFRLLKLCRANGFHELKLRAITTAKS